MSSCCLFSVSLAAAAPASAPLSLTIRQRVVPGSNSLERPVREKTVQWNPCDTAIIICDMWNQHWCKGATLRVMEMAPRMNEVASAARREGVLVIHAPSGCMKPYDDMPQRRRALMAPPAATIPKDIDGWCRKLEGEPNLPIDDSDGGCDCQPQCPTHSPWTRQIDAIKIEESDAVSDSGREIWNLLAARGIKHVLLMGVHTNMCVAGRPFGLRQMAKNGKDIALVRDLTDSMYNSRRAPFVCHRRGTELVIEHLETYVCGTVLADDIVGEPRRPHVVFVIGEDEYGTHETLPEFARAELNPHGLRCSFVHSNPKEPNDFPAIELVRSADLVVLSVRRRTPSREQLQVVREYLASGKPLVGIRTASHAFALRGSTPTPQGHDSWPSFDPEVLGGNYTGHHATTPKTRVAATAASSGHPILSNIRPLPFESVASLYKTTPLARSTTPLLVGSIPGQPSEPVAWTHTYKGARIFYTSLGHREDFRNPAFRALVCNAVFWAMERQAKSTDRKPPSR
jgi:type 1 glutamine amidotransferase/nicotinamidase-related amidase